MVLNLISTRVTLSVSRVPIDLTLIGSATRVRFSPSEVLSVKNTPSQVRVILNSVLFIISPVNSMYLDLLHGALNCSVCSVLSLKLASNKRPSPLVTMCVKPIFGDLFYMDPRKQRSNMPKEASQS